MGRTGFCRAVLTRPFGNCRNSPNIPTDKLFTGQRLDSTGLYYYNARYYDPTIGRFISPDTEGIDFNDPQSLNRYTYCSNNPLKYTDPSGQSYEDILSKAAKVKSGELNPTELRREINDTVEEVNKLIKAVRPNPTETQSTDLSLLGIAIPSGTGTSVIETLVTGVGLKILGLGGMILSLLTLQSDTNTDILKAEQGKIIEDIKNNPGKWEKTGEKSAPATGRAYKGGTSTDETFRNRETGQIVEKHTIKDPSGKIVHEHYRLK